MTRGDGILRIGTRGSPLARTQAELVCRALTDAHPELAEPGAVEVVVVRTTGDRVVDRPLAELGGKGLFCKELEAALLEQHIDLAVHSMKDLPTWLPDGLVIAAMLPRADPRDVLISRTQPCAIADLPPGAVVGTTSLRRRAQLLARRSDLEMVTLRGNLASKVSHLLVLSQCTFRGQNRIDVARSQNSQPRLIPIVCSLNRVPLILNHFACSLFSFACWKS